MSEFSNPFANAPKIANNITELIGLTPCVRLGATAVKNDVVANIILKMESFEPCSSVKDRIAKSMIEEAEKRGDIVPGKTIIGMRRFVFIIFYVFLGSVPIQCSFR